MVATEHEQKGPPLTNETLNKLLSSVDMSAAYAAPIDLFEKHLDTRTYLGWSNEFGQAMKQVPLNAWLCTDTLVGFFAYYFKGELAAVSWQAARKNGTELFWYSRIQAYVVRAYIRQLADAREPLALQLLCLSEPVPARWIERMDSTPTE